MAAEEPQVITCHTLESWKHHHDGEKESKRLVVVDFTASWCGPCRLITPVLQELAKKFSDVLFLKVDIDEVASVANEFSVQAVPTIYFLKEGKVVDKIVGANKDKLAQLVEQHATQTA